MAATDPALIPHPSSPRTSPPPTQLPVMPAPRPALPIMPAQPPPQLSPPCQPPSLTGLAGAAPRRSRSQLPGAWLAPPGHARRRGPGPAGPGPGRGLSGGPRGPGPAGSRRRYPARRWPLAASAAALCAPPTPDLQRNSSARLRCAARGRLRGRVPAAPPSAPPAPGAGRAGAPGGAQGKGRRMVRGAPGGIGRRLGRGGEGGILTGSRGSARGSPGKVGAQAGHRGEQGGRPRELGDHAQGDKEHARGAAGGVHPEQGRDGFSRVFSTWGVWVTAASYPSVSLGGRPGAVSDKPPPRDLKRGLVPWGAHLGP